MHTVSCFHTNYRCSYLYIALPFYRQLDTSPGKSFGGDDFSGAAKGNASGSGGGGAVPKLQDLDLALGLGGPATGPKKVLFVINLCFKQ